MDIYGHLCICALRDCQKNKLTDELDGLQKPAADVLFMVVLHRDTFILVRALKVVGAVRRDVEQRRDAV